MQSIYPKILDYCTKSKYLILRLKISNDADM